MAMLSKLGNVLSYFRHTDWAPAYAGVGNTPERLFPRKSGDPDWAPAFAGEHIAGETILPSPNLSDAG